MTRCLPAAALLLTAALALSGCAAPTPPPASSVESDQKLTQWAKKELDLPVIVRRAGKTVWVFAPMQTPLFAVKAAREPASSSTKSTQSPVINYLKAQYADGGFHVAYDIGKARKYPVSYGYQQAYGDEFNIAQRGLVQGLTDSYLDLSAEDKPDFFAMVLADIVNGVAAKIIVYRRDLERLMSMAPGFPQEEFSKRYVTEIYGNQRLIGDTTGVSVDYDDVAMADFLAAQMEGRIKFRFQYSSFSSAGSSEEILDEVRQTIENYRFEDFTGVSLNNLDTADVQTYSRADLQTLTRQAEPASEPQYQIFEFDGKDLVGE